MNIREIFKDDFSKSAFANIDGETRIIGKYGQLSIVDGLFDLWFVGKDLKYLSTKRINAIKAVIGDDLNVLKGEAWVQTKDEFKARYWAKFLGIRAKRKTTQAMLAKLAKARQIAGGKNEG